MIMPEAGQFYRIYFLLLFSVLFFVLIDGKGFGGSKGGGFKGGSRGAGTFSAQASHNRPNNYGTNMGKVRTGSGFKGKAMSFAAGAAGGIAAYSLMRAMAGSNSYRPGYYGPGYGVGETCYNNEDINGTRFGSFRCPMNDFPYEAKHCCGEYGKQFCCIREERSRSMHGASHFIWIVLLIVLLLIIALVWGHYQRQRRKEVIMVPTEIPNNEPEPAPFYHPPPPPMGYPPPPQGYPYGAPPQGNPYGAPPQNYQNNFNPYQAPPPQQMPYNPYPGAPSY